MAAVNAQFMTPDITYSIIWYNNRGMRTMHGVCVRTYVRQSVSQSPGRPCCFVRMRNSERERKSESTYSIVEIASKHAKQACYGTSECNELEMTHTRAREVTMAVVGDN